MKQVPLVFVFMSGKRKRDYRRVLRTLKQLAPTLNLAAIVMNFEAAMWRAATAVFTQTRLFGFNFHWTQAVWRKVQELGLQASYRDDDAIQRSICRKVMALPFLPPDHICHHHWTHSWHQSPTHACKHCVSTSTPPAG